ncbi:EamA family transporter [Achromobacter insuavis]
MRLIPVALALFWGLNWPAVKIVLSICPPFTLRLLGLGSGALLLLALARARGCRCCRRGRRGRASSSAASWPWRCSTWRWPGVQLSTSTSRAAVLTFTMPMMSALLAWAVLGERLDRRRGLALLLGGLGVAVLAWPVLRAIFADHDLAAARAWCSRSPPPSGGPPARST